jgi:transcriptional regulator with XRE-family HTH domain
VSFAAITQIESGRRKDIRLSSLAALATALQVSTDYLIGVHPADAPRLLRHEALLYPTEEALLATTMPFLASGLEGGHGVLVVTTPDRMKSLRKALGPDAKRVEFADAKRWYTSPADAIERYRKFIDRRFALGVPWIRILGEPVWASRLVALRGVRQRGVRRESRDDRLPVQHDAGHCRGARLCRIDTSGGNRRGGTYIRCLSARRGAAARSRPVAGLRFVDRTVRA